MENNPPPSAVPSAVPSAFGVKYKKNAQKWVFKGDSSTKHAQSSFLRNNLRCTQIVTADP